MLDSTPNNHQERPMHGQFAAPVPERPDTCPDPSRVPGCSAVPARRVGDGRSIRDVSVMHTAGLVFCDFLLKQPQTSRPLFYASHLWQKVHINFTQKQSYDILDLLGIPATKPTWPSASRPPVAASVLPQSRPGSRPAARRSGARSCANGWSG